MGAFLQTGRLVKKGFSIEVIQIEKEMRRI